MLFEFIDYFCNYEIKKYNTSVFRDAANFGINFDICKLQPWIF